MRFTTQFFNNRVLSKSNFTKQTNKLNCTDLLLVVILNDVQLPSKVNMVYFVSLFGKIEFQ